jgi:hypothetical protein
MGLIDSSLWHRYFFAVTNYFLYGESLIYYFKHILTLQAGYLPSAFSFAQQHRLISFSLYTLGETRLIPGMKLFAFGLVNS